MHVIVHATGDVVLLHSLDIEAGETVSWSLSERHCIFTRQYPNTYAFETFSLLGGPPALLPIFLGTTLAHPFLHQHRQSFR
jgi:hypothetical protein